MTCKQLHPFIVDLARGAIDAAAVEAQLARHVRGCADCNALLERERMMSAGLRRMADSVDVPAADSNREHALLAAFDEAAAAPKSRRIRFWVWSPALAAALLAAAVIAWRTGEVVPTKTGPTEAVHRETDTQRVSSAIAPQETRHRALSSSFKERQRSGAPTRRRTIDGTDDLRDAAFENAAFVAWPGAAAGPPLESGSLMRVDLPVSILPALGLWPPSSAETTVPVEILVGQDGFARAVRLALQ
jgi:hypothetical protein